LWFGLSFDYEALLNSFKSSTLSLFSSIDRFIENELDTLSEHIQFDFKLEALKRLDTPSLTLSATDGSMKVKRLSGLCALMLCSTSVLYELGVGAHTWLEKWPEQFYLKRAFVLPWVEDESESEELGATLMRYFEYYTLGRSLDSARVALKDGSILTDYTLSLKRALSFESSSLIGVETPFGAIDAYDLYVNMFRVLGFFDKESWLAKISEAEEKHGRALCKGVESEIQTLCERFPSKLSLSGDTLVLSEEAMFSNKKIEWLLDSFERRLERSAEHPLIFENRLFSRVDVELFTLFKVEQVFLKSIKKGALLIGVVKDSHSSSFLRTLARTKEIPSILSDKIALSAFSFKARLDKPWCTDVYNPLPYEDFGKTLEQTGFSCATPFVQRFYFQLFPSSEVFACETLGFGANELIKALLFVLAKEASSIPEALGYNYPLFEADKISKHALKEMEALVNSYEVLLLSDTSTSSYVNFLKSYREKRRVYEFGRKNS